MPEGVYAVVTQGAAMENPFTMTTAFFLSGYRGMQEQLLIQ